MELIDIFGAALGLVLASILVGWYFDIHKTHKYSGFMEMVTAKDFWKGFVLAAIIYAVIRFVWYLMA